MKNRRKNYIPPHSEVVFVCKDLCDGAHKDMYSTYTDGHGGGGNIGEAGDDDDPDAKGYTWDLWDGYDFDK